MHTLHVTICLKVEQILIYKETLQLVWRFNIYPVFCMSGILLQTHNLVSCCVVISLKSALTNIALSVVWRFMANIINVIVVLSMCLLFLVCFIELEWLNTTIEVQYTPISPALGYFKLSDRDSLKFLFKFTLWIPIWIVPQEEQTRACTMLVPPADDIKEKYRFLFQLSFIPDKVQINLRTNLPLWDLGGITWVSNVNVFYW